MKNKKLSQSIFFLRYLCDFVDLNFFQLLASVTNLMTVPEVACGILGRQ